MARLINGKLLAAEIRREIAGQIKKLEKKPVLAVLLVGEDPASVLYVSLKEKAAKEVGMIFEKHAFSADSARLTILQEIRKLNERAEVDAILVQLPLPEGFDPEEIIAAIDAEKDADGFHPRNLEAIRSGRPWQMPGVIEGILRLILSTGVELSGKQALLIVKSEVFSLPLAASLAAEGLRLEVILMPADRGVIRGIAKDSDIIVSATGLPELITSDMVKDGAVVIDVGATRLPGGRVVGDVLSEEFADRDVWLTPVPGGVGPVTVAMLLKRAAELARKRKQASKA